MNLPGAPGPHFDICRVARALFSYRFERAGDSIFLEFKQKNSCQSRRIRLQKAIIAKNRYNQLPVAGRHARQLWRIHEILWPRDSEDSAGGRELTDRSGSRRC